MAESPAVAALRSMLQSPVAVGELLSRHTSFRIGGPAELFVQVRSTLDLARALRFASDSQTPVHLLGSGTNVLVADEGIRGLVLKLDDEFKEVSWDGPQVTAGAAVPLIGLARRATDMGLSGLEFGAGIPGSLGGAVVMNAGTYLGCIGDVTRRVWLMDARGELAEVSKDEMGFGYRTSLLSREPRIVCKVEMVLSLGDREVMTTGLKEHLKRRAATQPLSFPSAGSCFKNPPGDYAGRLIEAVGAKGWRSGGAQVSELHANFLVNTGHATAKDVLALMERVKAAVRAQFGVELEPEIKIWGVGD
ncbi:MAG: UDP-N-acetylmuramate dehydrogenase [Symbiobacteriia bacterium]